MNVGQMKTEIQSLGYGTDTAAQQVLAIARSYRRILGLRRWPFLEVANNQSITAVAGTESYTLAGITDLMHLDAVRIEFGTDYPHIEFVPPQEFREIAHQDRAQGVPMYWTKIASSIYFWPRPDKAYKVDVDYIKRPGDLAADGDSPIWDAEYHDVLVWGAVRDFAFRQRDTAGYDLATEQYSGRLGDMLAEYGLRQRQNSSTVVRTGVHEAFDPRG